MVAVSAFCSAIPAMDSSFLFPFSSQPFRSHRRRPKTLAGAEGFEPPSPVLETGSLTVELTPLNSSGDCPIECPGKFRNHPMTRSPLDLFHFLMRRVLPA